MRKRTLLALLLAPLLVLCMPYVATAAAGEPVYGPKADADLHWDRPELWKPYASVDCTIRAQWKVTPNGFTDPFDPTHTPKDTFAIRYALQCKDEWAANLEGLRADIAFKGSGDPGTLDDESDPLNSDEDVSGETGFLYSGGFNVNEVCIGFFGDNTDVHNYAVECAPLPMGGPPGVESTSTTCAFGSVTKPTIHEGEVVKIDADGLGRGYASVPVRSTITNTDGNNVWKSYAVYEPVNGWDYAASLVEPLSPDQRASALDHPAMLAVGHQSLAPGTSGVAETVARMGPRTEYWADAPQVSVRIIGVGVVKVADSSDNINGWWTWAVRGPDEQQLGGVRELDRLGMTDPGQCAWYWGEKIAAVPGSDVDEPIGAIDGVVASPIPADPPDDPENEPDPSDEAPTEPGCDFDIAQPDSWLSGGMCALVGLFKKVISLLSSVVDGIGAVFRAVGRVAQQILGGLAALFIPSDGFLTSKVNGLKAKWGDTTPSNWMEAITGLSVGSVSGCEGLPLQFELQGVEVDERIGGACTGTMATVANLVRLAIQATVIVGGGLACLRALGSGIGWAPGIGKGV